MDEGQAQGRADDCQELSEASAYRGPPRSGDTDVDINEETPAMTAGPSIYDDGAVASLGRGTTRLELPGASKPSLVRSLTLEDARRFLVRLLLAPALPRVLEGGWEALVTLEPLHVEDELAHLHGARADLAQYVDHLLVHVAAGCSLLLWRDARY